jgi:cytochrome c oxidase subunit 3
MILNLDKLEKQHPRLTLFQLGIFGITLLFLGILLLYWINTEINYEKFNKSLMLYCVFNIVPLYFSGWALKRAYRSWAVENLKSVIQFLSIALLCSLSFCLLQISAGMLLVEDAFYHENLRGNEFFLTLIGLHVFHVLGGLCFLVFEILKAYKTKQEPGGHLVYQVNLYQGLKLKMLLNYWVLMDIVYLAIVLRFLLHF